MHEFICINPGNMWRNPPTAFTVINQSNPEHRLVHISTVVTPRTQYTQILFNLVKSFTTPVIFGKSFPGLELTRVYAGN